jgi:hypothetical protein
MTGSPPLTMPPNIAILGVCVADIARMLLVCMSLYGVSFTTAILIDRTGSDQHTSHFRPYDIRIRNWKLYAKLIRSEHLRHTRFFD